MENIQRVDTPEKMTPPAAEVVAKIFMQYWGQQFFVKKDGQLGGGHGFKLIGVRTDGPIVMIIAAGYPESGYNWHRCSVFVNKLENVTDEHAEKIGRILRHDFSSEIALAFGRTFINLCLIKKVAPTFLSHPLYIAEAIDTLRMLGYATPYGPWSIESLVECGIYKIIENGK